MSIAAGKLLLFALVPAVGAGVAYPMITKLGGGREISLKQISDFEQKCWVSVKGGEENDRDSYKKKLLACSIGKSDDTSAEFYFYDETSGASLPKKVTAVKVDGDSKFTVTVEGGTTESISTNGATWNNVFSEGINKGCKINKTIHTDDPSGNARKLGCGDKYPQPLDEFQTKK